MRSRAAIRAYARSIPSDGRASLPPASTAQQPFRFKDLAYELRSRSYGSSKLDTLVVWEYVMLVGDKLVGHIIPVRFLSFALVGGIGLVVHLAVLGASLRLLGFSFEISQAAATLIALVCNFALNHVLSYRDLRARGSAFPRGCL